MAPSIQHRKAELCPQECWQREEPAYAAMRWVSPSA